MHCAFSISSLKEIQGKSYSSIDSPIYGKHNNTSIYHCVVKLQLFLLTSVIYFPHMYLLHISVAATLSGFTSKLYKAETSPEHSFGYVDYAY